jgi:hypothetical protein
MDRHLNAAINLLKTQDDTVRFAVDSPSNVAVNRPLNKAESKRGEGALHHPTLEDAPEPLIYCSVNSMFGELTSDFCSQGLPHSADISFSAHNLKLVLQSPSETYLKIEGYIQASKDSRRFRCYAFLAFFTFSSISFCRKGPIASP